jgi:hypothetical protein
MARIAIDLSPVQWQKAKTLVDTGIYDSIQQFGEIAFANQLVLEDGADPEDLAQATRERRSTKADGLRKRILPLPPSRAGARKEKDNDTAASGDRATIDRSSPESDASLSFETAVRGLSLKVAPTPGPAAVETISAPREQKILALINKPFGLKIVARALLVNATHDWPAADELAHLVARQAAAVGAELAGEDRLAERRRNLLHTGLPTPDSPESLERFTMQYVGRIARSGHVTPGGVVQFAIASLSDGRIALSTAGIEFARLLNPVLDGGLRPWERVLSAAEQKFLIEHITRFVPGEAKDAYAVVDAVRSGNNRPESLLMVKDLLPSAWTDVQVRSYLSGLVSRLSELGVLNRVWVGRTVHYELATNAPIVLRAASAREVA